MTSPYELKFNCYAIGEDIHLDTYQRIGDETKRVMHEILQTREAAIRKQLIMLGWTPPMEGLK